MVSEESIKSVDRPSVHLAFAKPSDVPAIVRIDLLAFESGEYQSVLWPEQADLSTADLLSQLCPPYERKFRRELVGHDIFIKATIRSQDTGEEVIAGFAIWSNPARSRKRTLWEWLWAKILYPLHDYLFPPVLPSGLPLQVKGMFAAQYNATFGPGGVAEGSDNWYLHVACVEPKWQGKGVGSALLQWGFDEAEKDNVPVYVESSPHGLPIYLAKGFRIASQRSCEINGKTIILPGMIWIPNIGKRNQDR